MPKRSRMENASARFCSRESRFSFDLFWGDETAAFGDSASSGSSSEVQSQLSLVALRTSHRQIEGELR